MRPADLLARPGAQPDPKAADKVSPAFKSAKMARLRKATREFEAIFVEHIMKTARQSPAGGRGLFPSGAGHDLYHDMVDENLARAMSAGGGLGLSDLLMKNLVGAKLRNPSSSIPIRPIGNGNTGRRTGGPQ
jgi:flagellar protein FlgJ